MKKTPPRSMTSLCILLLVTLFQCGGSKLFAAAPNETPLVAFFQQWRQFELPTMNGNVPDYTPEAMTAKAAALPQWRDRLEALDRTGWSLQQQDDSKLIQAEMNGLDFSLRVLRPWARDPSFYVSIWPSRTDVPSREAGLLSGDPALQLSLPAFVRRPARPRHQNRHDPRFSRASETESQGQ
jgi:hypothetical protein